MPQFVPKPHRQSRWRHPWPDKLAYIPERLCNASQGQWGTCQDSAGAVAAPKGLPAMNLCAQAVTDLKRKAQSRIVDMLLDKNDGKQSTPAIGTKRTYEKILQRRKLWK